MSRTSVPQSEPERREWLKMQLRLKGLTVRKLAEMNGVSKTPIAHALQHSYPKMERLIAAAIGLTAEEIWPDRFAARRARERAFQGAQQRVRQFQRQAKRKGAQE